MKTAFKAMLQLKIQLNKLMYFAGNTSLASELKNYQPIDSKRTRVGDSSQMKFQRSYTEGLSRIQLIW